MIVTTTKGTYIENRNRLCCRKVSLKVTLNTITLSDTH